MYDMPTKEDVTYLTEILDKKSALFNCLKNPDPLKQIEALENLVKEKEHD